MASCRKTVYLPAKDYELPNIDILTLIYDSPESWTSESTVLPAEAALPSNSVTKSQSRTYTQRLAWLFHHVFSIGANGPAKDVVVCISSGQVLLSNVFFGVIAAHIAGCQGYFVNPSIAGGLCYWMPKFDFPKFLEYNKKFRITFFFTVPPIHLLIAKSPLVTDQFASLAHAIAGAAPMGAELQALAGRKLGCQIKSDVWVE